MPVGRLQHWGQPIAATIVVLVATLPFLSKPFHIDDPSDLEYVRQVLRDPINPYGFEMDWDQGPRPAYENYHPPLKYYYQALVLAFVPLSEVVVHFSYLPFVILTVWSAFVLARRFDCSPTLLAALFIIGPAYLPGQNAMLDVPAVALGLAATALLITGVDRDQVTRYLLAGVLLGCALLAKYSALIYVPIFLAYLAGYGRARHWFSFLIACLIFGAWCIVSAVLYGEIHAKVLFMRVPGHELFPTVKELLPSLLDRLLPAAVFLGGAMPGALLLFGMGRKAGKIVLLGSAVMAFLCVWFVQPTSAHPSFKLTTINLCWWWLLATVGLGLLALIGYGTVVAGWRFCRGGKCHRDQLFLGCWFAVAFLLGAFFSPFLAMRRVLETSVIAWLILLRQIPANRRHKTPVWCVLVLNTIFGVMVAAADYEYAATYPNFARKLAARTGPNSNRVWCYGYWGWSYYTRANGLPHYILGGPEPPPGSLLVIPQQVARPAQLTPRLAAASYHSSESVPGRLPLRVMNYQAGAGYYSNTRGPLPYAWSNADLETFRFFRLNGHHSP